MPSALSASLKTQVLRSVSPQKAMAASNPILRAYNPLPPSCSEHTYCIAGLLTTVYGLDELSSSDGKVACLWLLHPRLEKQSSMKPVAHSAIDTWNKHTRANKHAAQLPGLMAVTFDQRNHGSRELDPRANQDWKSGNEHHAQDMFATYRSLLEKFP